MDSLLFALKLLGLIVAACLGVFATVHDYRDKITGHLTRWGKGAIFGLIFSTAVAVVAQIMEEAIKDKSTKEAASQAAEAAMRSEVLVRDLARVLQPLKFERIHIHDLWIPLADERFKQLRSRIDDNAKAYQSRYENARLPLRARDSGTSASGSICNKATNRCAPLNVEVDVKSPVFPQKGLEHAVFAVHSVRIAIYKTPIDPARVEHLIYGGENSPDVGFDFTGWSSPLSISRDVTTGAYKLTGAFDKQWLGSDASGRVTSLPDLAGSQLFLRLPSNSLPDDMVNQPIFGVPVSKLRGIGQSQVVPYQSQFELGTVSFDLGKRTMWVPRSAWRKHATKTAVYWEYIIPADPFKARPEQ